MNWTTRICWFKPKLPQWRLKQHWNNTIWDFNDQNVGTKLENLLYIYNYVYMFCLGPSPPWKYRSSIFMEWEPTLYTCLPHGENHGKSRIFFWVLGEIWWLNTKKPPLMCSFFPTICNYIHISYSQYITCKARMMIPLDFFSRIETTNQLLLVESYFLFFLWGYPLKFAAIRTLFPATWNLWCCVMLWCLDLSVTSVGLQIGVGAPFQRLRLRFWRP